MTNKSRVARRIVRLVSIAVVTVVVVKATTVGWRGNSILHYLQRNTDITIPQFRSKAFRQNSDSSLLRSHVVVLSHTIGDRNAFVYQNLQQAAEYIRFAFEELGYEIRLQNFDVYGKTVCNIIAQESNKDPENILIIGAHYDSCFNPGADDNASGIAGLLLLARRLKNQAYTGTIRFVAFVNEEPPFFKTELMGSRVYARQAKSQSEHIKGVIILESIGFYTDRPFSQRYPPLFGLFYPNKGNFIGVVGNFASQRLVQTVARGLKHNSSLPIETITTFSSVPGVDFSDHWSFWKEGYQAVMFTDTAFYRNPYYHTNEDTPEKLDYNSLSELVNGLTDTVVALAR